MSEKQLLLRQEAMTFNESSSRLEKTRNILVRAHIFQAQVWESVTADGQVGDLP